MFTWNYRTIKFVDEAGNTTFQVYEISYNEAGEIIGRDLLPTHPEGETLEALRFELEQMLLCLNEEILEDAKIVYTKHDWGSDEPSIPWKEVRRELGLDE
ncbi:MAG: hypothetical protein K9J28_06150 [Sulfuritalea sp.]|nr:hypothetical protein [Sulfuritalea sp.]